MFRTHLGRPLDIGHTSNKLIIALTAAMAVGGVGVWLAADVDSAWLAPVHTFLIWALVRELDPDRHWTALAAGLIAGVWVLVGLEVAGALAIVGLLLAARVVLNPVGLSLLTTDVLAMVAVATAISFTPVGWVAGSGIAVALYIDTRLSDFPRRVGYYGAVAAALGAAAIATITDALPETIPSINPVIVVVTGLLALIIVVRDPLPVLSNVDHNDQKRMSSERLHGSRVLAVVLVFASTLLAGPAAGGLVPTIIAFVLVLASEELKRVRRPTL